MAESKKLSLVEAAALEAKQRIRDHVALWGHQSFRQFLRALAIKGAILVSVLTGMEFTALPQRVWLLIFVISVSMLTFYDLYRLYPRISYIARQFWSAGGSLRQTTKRLVAARVLEDVLNEAEAGPKRKRDFVVLTLIGTSRDRFTREVAEQVAEIAADAAWADVRPIMFNAAFKMTTMAALYGATTWYALTYAP
jgi:hypothetical protein